MTGWAWLKQDTARWSFVARVVLKALALFVVLNLLFALADPLPVIGRASVYGWLVPPRERLPYGENPDEAFSLSLNSLDAMFASQALARPKAPDEYRVLVLGDSSTWGFLLRPDETLTAYLNAEPRLSSNGRRIRAYNLGYPIMSLAKDVLLLDYAMQYEPDMVVWVMTMESFARDKQLFPPLVQQNPQRMQRLISDYNLRLTDSSFAHRTLPERTIIGQRRELADWLRLQLYGFAWSATGIDQDYPETYELRTSDFNQDVTWQTFTEPQPLSESDLAFDVLRTGIARAGDIPVLLVNEPMFISSGENSDLRYNFFYPRWAYDEYHALLIDAAQREDWALLNLWNTIAPDEFTDSPVHLTPVGSRQLAELIAPELVALTDDE